MTLSPDLLIILSHDLCVQYCFLNEFMHILPSYYEYFKKAQNVLQEPVDVSMKLSLRWKPFQI